MKTDLSDFESLIQGALVLIFFVAEFNEDSQKIIELFKNLKEQEQSDAEVYIVDVDESPEVTDKYEVEKIPSIFLFKAGILVDQIGGVVGTNVVYEMIRRNL